MVGFHYVIDLPVNSSNFMAGGELFMRKMLRKVLKALPFLEDLDRYRRTEMAFNIEILQSDYLK